MLFVNNFFNSTMQTLRQSQLWQVITFTLTNQKLLYDSTDDFYLQESIALNFGTISVFVVSMLVSTTWLLVALKEH